MQERYRPANAPLAEAERRIARSSLVAVLLGGLIVDAVGGTLISSIISGIWNLVIVARSSALPDPISLDVPALALAEPVARIASSVTGGYVAALWAGHRPVAHGLGAGLTCLTFYLLLSIVMGGTLLWTPFAIFPPTLGALGGYLQGARERRR